MFVKNNKLLEKVMKSELCNRCGSCVGLSNGKVRFADKIGRYKPEIIEPLTEEETNRIWNACSGQMFDFPKYREIFYKNSQAFHSYLGSYNNIYIGFSKDPKIRINSASGGLISATLIYLLENKKIDGVITLRMSEKEPWFTEPFIATTRQEIFDAAQSKYIITSVNEILSTSKDFKGRLAFVGLPGQVQSIRKLQAANDPAVRNIDYIFGPFYGNTLYFSSVISFLKTYGIKNYTEITKLYFRYGEWPGNMRVELKNGKVFELKKFHANYLIPFHILKNSLYCTDFTNEFTDISGGDAWAPVYEERGKGFSLVISRTKKGQDLLEEMVASGKLELNTIDEQEAITMHSHGYDFKKRGSFIRIKFRKMLGKAVPDYGYKLSGFPASRYLMEIVISTLFIVLGTKPARWMVEQFKPEFIGKIFEKSRNIWKKSTHKIKRNSLN